MSKVILLLILFFGFLFIYPHIYGEAKAQAMSITPSEITNKDTNGVDIKINGLILDNLYTAVIDKTKTGPLIPKANYLLLNEKPDSNGEFSFHVCPLGPNYNDIKRRDKCTGQTFQEGTYYIMVYAVDNPGSPLVSSSFKVIIKTAGVIAFQNKSFKTTDDIKIKVSGIPDGSYLIQVDNNDPKHKENRTACIDTTKGIFEYNLGQYYEGFHNIQIYTDSGPGILCNKGSFMINQTFEINNTTGGKIGPVVGVGTTNPAEAIRIKKCTDKDPNDPSFDAENEAVCASGGGKLIEGCSKPGSPGYDPKNPGIATAIGCIHTNPAELVKDLLKFVIAIGGGLAFLMMLLGAYQMLSSQGNPETLNAGRERLTSAVIGLLFIIFAVLLLQIIGADILGIPGFGRQV